MYAYNHHDQQIVTQRVNQFRDQAQRYLEGKLDEKVYKQLRLRNGLYVQRHAPMLRVAVPYGVLNSEQMRCLADIARRFDRGYVHVTTQQNFQINWPDLADVPDMLEELDKCKCMQCTDLVSYMEAILRVYHLHGRCDNLYIEY